MFAPNCILLSASLVPLESELHIIRPCVLFVTLASPWGTMPIQGGCSLTISEECRMTAAHPLPLYHTALFNSLKQWYSFLFLKKMLLGQVEQEGYSSIC